MSCDICGRGACSPWMHSSEEQERFAPAIEAFDRARDIRERIRNEQEEQEREKVAAQEGR